jgi:ligand-binding SRPBCC domain-containing protein
MERKAFWVSSKYPSSITIMNARYCFVDEMEEGYFKSFRHQHFFEETNGVTIRYKTANTCYQRPKNCFLSFLLSFKPNHNKLKSYYFNDKIKM